MNAIVRIDGVPHTPMHFDKTRLLALMEAGLLPDDRKIEMIDGVLIEMSPANNDHGVTLANLIAAVIPPLPAGLKAATDVAIFLAENVMLAPDLAILPDPIITQQAKGPDLTLAIEVADTTIRDDLRDKAPVYARHDVAELWIVDVRARQLHVCREPDADGYRSIVVLDEHEPAGTPRIPNLTLRLSDVLPRAVS